MNCGPLPDTGLDANLGLFLLVAGGFLVLGMVLLHLSRHRRTRTGTAVLILSIAGAAVAIPPGTPVRAADGSDCGPTENSLTVVQTSTMAGLAPGLAPVAITGLVVNNSLDSTYLTAVEVEITGVTTQPGSARGTCDASDYLLTNTRMRVERTLGPGESTPFAGAAIGFRNKNTNQDACQRATVHLLYTANPH